LTGEI